MRAINLEFKQQIKWPAGNHMVDYMSEFQCYYSLPGVVGAIDGIQNLKACCKPIGLLLLQIR